MAKLAMMQVLASVEDEKTFFNLIFLKSQLRNSLEVQMEVCVCFFSQPLFKLQTSHTKKP